MNDRETFLAGLQQLNIPLTPAQLEQVDRYVELLKHWNRTHNLVAPSTLPYAYTRHVLDSAQLAPYLATNDKVLDIGSGAGLPAVIMAILAPAGAVITACERITKKAAFLKEVRRQLQLTERLKVEGQDVAALTTGPYDVITARAVAPLVDLVDLGLPQLTQNGKFLFLKGQEVETEIKAVKTKYRMTISCASSITNAQGKIVKLGVLQP